MRGEPRALGARSGERMLLLFRIGLRRPLPGASFCSQLPFPLPRCRVAARAEAGRDARFLAWLCAWCLGLSLGSD